MSDPYFDTSWLTVEVVSQDLPHSDTSTLFEDDVEGAEPAPGRSILSAEAVGSDIVIHPLSATLIASTTVTLPSIYKVYQEPVSVIGRIYPSGN